MSMQQALVLSDDARRTLRWALFFVAMALPVVGAALLQVSLRQEAVALGYRLSHAETQREQLRGMIRKAELERAAGRTPVRLQQVALSLGLVPPAPLQLLTPRDTPVDEHAQPAGTAPPASAARRPAKQLPRVRAISPSRRPSPRNARAGT